MQVQIHQNEIRAPKESMKSLDEDQRVLCNMQKITFTYSRISMLNDVNLG